MLKPKKSGLDYSKVDSMSKNTEPKTGIISAMSKDSISPQLQKKIDAAKERALNIKQVAKEAGRSGIRGAQISNEAAKLAARAAAKKKGQ